MRFLRAQIVKFSHHLGDVECTNAFRCFWDFAKFMLVVGASEAKKSQLFIYIIVESRILPRYVYIHEDKIMQDMAGEFVVQTWVYLRHTLSERLSKFRGCLDLILPIQAVL